MIGVLCGAKIPTSLKGKVYKTMIRQVKLYEEEATNKEGLLKITKIRMLHWILGVWLKVKERNEVIRKTSKGHLFLTKYERPD